MTNEEASCVLHCPDAYGGIYGQKYGEALAHCFELLKQEPVLDKIKTEFISLYPKNHAGEPELGGLSCVFSLDKVLEILDKYKAESEE